MGRKLLRCEKAPADGACRGESTETRIALDASAGAKSSMPRTAPGLLAALLTAAVAPAMLAEELAVARDLREDWDIARVRSELAQLVVHPETECSDEPIQGGWRDREREILSLHGGRLSPYDGLCFPNLHYVDIEHIVARKEADESGMCGRTTAEREAFAMDTLNLTFAPASLNASKGALDAGDLQAAQQSLFRDELTAAGRCFWAAQTVRVKRKYGLGVDTEEREALDVILAQCAAECILATRPQAPVECEWAVRPEFALAVIDTMNAPKSYCAEPPGTESWQAALQYTAEILCLDGVSGSPAQPEEDGIAPNPRAGQIAAQEACREKLTRINCGSIMEQCPSVGVIHRGEPLYQPRGTNDRSNDSDDDGLYCETP